MIPNRTEVDAFSSSSADRCHSTNELSPAAASDAALSSDDEVSHDRFGVLGARVWAAAYAPNGGGDSRIFFRIVPGDSTNGDLTRSANAKLLFGLAGGVIKSAFA